MLITGENGRRKRDFFYTLRRDGAGAWLFLARCDPPSRTDGADCRREKIKVRVTGEYRPTLYDTVRGQIRGLPYTRTGGCTEIEFDAYPLDSFLFSLRPDGGERFAEHAYESVRQERVPKAVHIAVGDDARYTTGERNAAVLDLCEWSIDGSEYFPREEMLRIDKALRLKYGYPMADGYDKQPWCISAQEPRVFPYLRFTFESEIVSSCALAYEHIKEVWFNGESVQVADEGYYVDEAIRVMRLPALKKGKNVLIVRVPVSERISLENLFLLGDFGVRAQGSRFTVIKRQKKICYGSLATQGFPFYGADVTYRIPFSCGRGDLAVTADHYKGALVGVKLDGKDVGKIVLPPYELKIENVARGKHELELTLYLSRVNTFGALHCCVPLSWKGPSSWYTEGNAWSYEYCLKEGGIMKKPYLTLFPR